MAEIVYILINEAMPGLIKIGRTNQDLAARIKGLYQTGVPLPFELFFACEVHSSADVEGKLHEAFGDHRVSKNREFFRLAPERAKAALSLAMIKQIRLGDEIF
ncbi:MAG TPA: GIY-YIG nuclease family protein, partial [Xanthobacteraceae bacterium]|nr:GIY-YIG nuclease family protein [Xanthobacteraceae bacterium]